MMSTIDIRLEEHRISTQDNTLLYATLYAPPSPRHCNDRAVLIAPALGVTKRHYAAYARFLADHGFAVLTFDYRGVGDSLAGESLRGYDATLQDWGAQDVQAAIFWMMRQHPAHEIFVVGHSIGGSLVGLADEAKSVDGLLGIAAQTAHMSAWPVYRWLPLLLMWYLIIPLSSQLAGYFPSGLFGMGEPVPKGVGLEWAQLGRTKSHFKAIIPPSHNHFNDFRGALALFSFSDDGFAPQSAVDNLQHQYPNAELTVRQHVDKRELGVEQIGHMGFFREQFRDTLWQDSLAWLTNPHRQRAPQSEAEAVAS